jgi:hypothetical protein
MATSAVAPGQKPGSAPLSIGGVEFNSSETPTTLPVGVEQMTTTHTLVGGTRVVQNFGVSPKEITWNGKFFDTYQTIRVEQLRNYASSGTPVDLNWQGKELYTVIVKEFTPTFRGQYVEYTITLVVIQANTGAYYAYSPNQLISQINSLNDQANALVSTMASLDYNNTLAIQNAQKGVNAELQQATPSSIANPAQSKTLQLKISSAIAAIQLYQETGSVSLSLLPIAIQAQGCLQAMLQNVTTGSSAQTIQTQGGNLFQVAAQYTGSATQAYAIAGASALSSVFLPNSTFTKIVLPSTGTQTNYSSVLGN